MRPITVIIAIVLAVAAFGIGIYRYLYAAYKPPLAFAKHLGGPEAGVSMAPAIAINRSPDGKVLVTVTDHNKLQFWDLTAGKLLRDVESGSTESIFAPTCSKDGSSFAAVDSVSSYGKQYGHLQFWNPDSGERTTTIEGLNWPYSAKFETSGTVVAAGATNDLYLVDTVSQKITATVGKWRAERNFGNILVTTCVQMEAIHRHRTIRCFSRRTTLFC